MTRPAHELTPTLRLVMAARSPKTTAPAFVNAEWPELLGEALNMPGQMGDNYSRFKPRGYNSGNQVLLLMQGAGEPVNAYKRWSAMNRQVQRGSKASTSCSR